MRNLAPNLLGFVCPPLGSGFPTDVSAALMSKIEFQQSIEVRLNMTTLLESESSPATKLRPKVGKRLPNRPTTVADTLPLVRGMIRSPDGDITILGEKSTLHKPDVQIGNSGQAHWRGEMRANGLDRERHGLMTPATAGFILTGAKWSLIYANPEAKMILTYPAAPGGFELAWTALQKRMIPLLNKQNSSSAPHLEFMSGSRKYISRVLPLTDSHGERPFGAVLAVLLERSGAASLIVDKLCAHFNLTAREFESVECLVNGLTNKEIAARMNISPNTVRTFLRIVMLKLGVSTRSGIVGVIFRTVNGHSPSSPPVESVSISARGPE